MSILVSAVITRARSLMHDLKNGHYVREFLNEQANGVTVTYQVRNRNLLQASDGAPTDVKLFLGTTNTTITALDKDAGLLTIAVAAAQGVVLDARYYFEMATDAEWLNFFNTAAGFVGYSTPVTDVTQNVAFDVALVPAVELYAAAQASRALASLTHWYYSANQGNKNFNKDQISRKFMEQAAGFESQAEKRRADAYTRFDQAKAPAVGYITPRGLRYWEPPR